jgi:zinc D-Ala-D-Ala carboxypeptidase
MGDLEMNYKYFRKEEFACPCCGENKIKDEFVEKLDKAREIAGIPFIINSGYRCPKHNKEIGGSPTSSHLKGLAADIKTTNSRERFKILDSLLKVGFKRVGIGEYFIHVDLDTEKVQEVAWDYYKKH